MSFEVAQRATEILLAIAFVQQSVEHLAGSRFEARLFAVRLVLSGFLLAGAMTGAVLVGLVLTNLMALQRFQGPYNGGSDRMGGLILYCLALSYAMPNQVWQERVFGYLAVQVILSYVVSGLVKLCNRDWLKGQALCDVFAFSAYPVSTELRALADRTSLLFSASWCVILFEVLFPLSFLSSALLLPALCVGSLFHLANAFLFGLNRFFWVWLASYPSLIWLQDRVVGS